MKMKIIVKVKDIMEEEEAVATAKNQKKKMKKKTKKKPKMETMMNFQLLTDSKS